MTTLLVFTNARRKTQVDCLVNVAGIQGEMKPIYDYPTLDFDRIMRVNVTGTFIVMKVRSMPVWGFSGFWVLGLG